jgi:hypothetical protein
MRAFRENWGNAFLGGLLAAFLMVPFLYLFQPIEHTRVDIAMFLGSLFTARTDAPTWALGFGIHLLIGGLLGVLYGFIFEVLGRADWWRGALISIFHSMVAGLVLWGVGSIHPLAGNVFPEPGYLGLNANAAIAFHMIVLNALFGSVMGGVYRVRAEHRGYFGLHKPQHA